MSILNQKGAINGFVIIIISLIALGGGLFLVLETQEPVELGPITNTPAMEHEDEHDDHDHEEGDEHHDQDDNDTPSQPPVQDDSKPACRPTGCSSEICADEEIASACIFKPEFACYKAATCERQPSGNCGWTQTPELQQCIESAKDPGGPIIQQPPESQPFAYSGTLLAGDSTTPLLDFNKTDYDLALSQNKDIALYFYASWCPLCRIEFPKMEDAFDQLDRNDLVGFRVNFNDNDTDSHEKDLAREHGVAYQHTKVFIRDGQRILKNPEQWSIERYIDEISSAF